MHGSRIEYIVQIRIQDYWLDHWLDYGDGIFNGLFKYRNDAEAYLAEVKKNRPDMDFQLIKRTHSFIDEIL